MKTDVLVRFAGDSTYYNRITIDPKKIENPMVFPNEVFFTIHIVQFVQIVEKIIFVEPFKF